MSQNLRCPSCKGYDIDFSEASGDATCVACGTVCEESTIVSSVEFTDGAGGTSNVVGQFVSASCTKPYGGMSGRYVRGGGGRRYGFLRSSRETTLANGRKKIETVASNLRLGAFYIDSAHRLFTMAAQRNFTHGRQSLHIACACLYIVCRQQESAHMLVDFSDIINVNVYALGATYLKFRRLLNLELPIIDPSLYIHRFAAKLNLGDKTSAVATTAMHVVQRMKRDWIQTGRRPAGLCAAALLIGARAHGFHRTKDDVVKALRVCGMTVANRLADFRATPASKLTITQFDSAHGGGDEFGEADPPSFNRRGGRPQLENEVIPQITAMNCDENGGAEKEKESPQITAQTKGKKRKARPKSAKKPLPVVVCCDDGDRETMTIGQLAMASLVKRKPSSQAKRRREEKNKGKETDPPLLLSAPPPEKSIHTQSSVQGITAQQTSLDNATNLSTAQSLNLSQNLATAMNQEVGENFDDVHDDEIDGMILSPAESKLKADKWADQNKDYVQKQRDKSALNEARAEAAGLHLDERQRPRKKSRSTTRASSSSNRKYRSSTSAAVNKGRTAEQALIGVVEKKRLSRKINYDALKGIFGADSSTGDDYQYDATNPAQQSANLAQNNTAHQEKEDDLQATRNITSHRASRSDSIQRHQSDENTQSRRQQRSITTPSNNVEPSDEEDEDGEFLNDDLDDDYDQEYA